MKRENFGPIGRDCPLCGVPIEHRIRYDSIDIYDEVMSQSWNCAKGCLGNRRRGPFVDE